MQVLRIQNRGIVSKDFLSIVGASTARGNDDAIGQFGSGFKFSVALLMRLSLDFKICIGKDVFEFSVDEREAKDVRGYRTTIKEVVMKQVAGSSRKTKGMGYDMNWGEVHWTSVDMAIREFISNAADASMSLQGNYDDVEVELVDEPGKWAKDGYTRVYIQANSDVRRYYDDLKRNFLIFSKDFNINEAIISKPFPTPLHIYRKGVMVGKFDEVSMFDYNLNHIDVTESRTISEYAAKAAVARALKMASPSVIEDVINAFIEDKRVFEVQDIDINDLKAYDWDKKYSPGMVTNWTDGIINAIGDAIPCDNIHDAEAVTRKGFKPVLVSETVRKVLESYDTKTAHAVLGSFELGGRQKQELPASLVNDAVKLWETLKAFGMTKDKDMPQIEGFADVMDAGSRLHGYYDPKRNVVGINADTFDSELEFNQTLLEELAHYVTGSGDNSRDIQEYVFKFATKLFINSK